VEGSAPTETKEETARRVGAINVGALTTLGTFAPNDRKSRHHMMEPLGTSVIEGAAEAVGE
jgi:hypothetical protein